ncbi:FG-GAP repeat protein [Luteolibacter flavescens]|uniref:FG-GAP repeat protein n=1 Tax=Luteolibacter flavescens TaxID=1859460 RepID=A0ABT3FJG7_9BACT|nr:FG-GAP repeat protein [Luteolibacter flavescens]MCW1883708.1 FG-GAP repeat protein [Luteolibacter flavescens]
MITTVRSIAVAAICLPFLPQASQALTAAFDQNVSGPRNNNRFGDNIVAVGNFMAVSEDNRVLLYERNGGTWEPFARKPVLLSTGDNSDEFGHYVLMPDRNTIFVSDPLYNARTPSDGTNNDQGAVYVYGRDVGGDNNWGLIKQITATDHQLPNGALSKGLGDVMAYSDGRLVVSAKASSVGMKFLYVFEKDRGGTNQWGQVPGVKLEGTDLSMSHFAYTLALTGDTLIVGSPFEGYRETPSSPSDIGRGALFIYHRNQGGSDRWGLLPNGRRYAPDGVTADYFGRTISISGDQVAVGAIGRDLSSTQRDAGTVYILSRNEGGPGNWGITPTRITAPDAAAGDEFGAVAVLRGDVLAVCANNDDVAGVNDAGSIYLFEKATTGTWQAVSGGKFSIDNVPGITLVNTSFDTELFMDDQRVMFWSRTSSIGRVVTDIRLTGFPSPGGLGTVDFSRLGRITFTPRGTGNYQLRTSTDLQGWTDVGVPFPASSGVPKIIETGTPGAERKRFYRIESR